MTMIRITRRLFPAMLCLGLLACSASPPPDTAAPAASSTTEDSGWLARQIHDGMEQARHGLATKNLDLNGIMIYHTDWNVVLDTRPDAAITPDGQFLLEGKPVKLDPAQHALVQDYRRKLLELINTGLDVGEKSSALGLRIARESLFGALGGKSREQLDALIESQSRQIEIASQAVCRKLPALLQAQQELAAALPAFRPYATLQQKHIDHCFAQVSPDSQ